MTVEEKALLFYQILMIALKSDGIDKIMVTLTPDGELQADIYVERNMTDWVSIKDGLPEIDYDNHKSATKCKIKINDNEDFVLDAYFRETFSSDKRIGYIFYTMDGKSYYGVTHWKYLIGDDQ